MSLAFLTVESYKCHRNHPEDAEILICTSMESRGRYDVMQDVYDAIHAKVEAEPFAGTMGLKLIKVDKGYSLVEMQITHEMENIHGMAHGGAIFSLIDEAFEVASNSHGTMAVALNMNITYISAPRIGDYLRAEATEMSKTTRTANYSITVKDSEDNLIAACQALVYRKKERLPFLKA
jgi:acyl-CoA thioesterase